MLSPKCYSYEVSHTTGSKIQHTLWKKIQSKYDFILYWTLHQSKTKKCSGLQRTMCGPTVLGLRAQPKLTFQINTLHICLLYSVEKYTQPWCSDKHVLVFMTLQSQSSKSTGTIYEERKPLTHETPKQQTHTNKTNCTLNSSEENVVIALSVTLSTW